MSQLALPLQLQDHAVFESFLASANDAVVAYLKELAETVEGDGCWLWGGAATGKTHLLQATCARLGDRSAYVPFEQLMELSPAVLDGLASRNVVCIDDVGLAAGKSEWEIALFNLYNEIFDADGTLIVAAAASPRDSGFSLPDLQSRFSRLPVFQIAALADDDRSKALQLRARHRGLELPDETASFLLARTRRDMASLYELLDRLDSESLRAQRRLTIPFVRDVLEL